MKIPFLQRRRLVAFTLVELLVVVAIISLLAGLGMPAYTQMMQRAQSIKCATNLRAIGIAVTQAVADNNNQYPEINQTAPPLPYPVAGSPPGTPVPGGLVAVLGAYGVTTNMIQCPVDMQNGATSNFQQYGSSYTWNPATDDEVVTSPLLYFRPGVAIPIHSSRVRLAFDFTPVHKGKANVLYGDGHVAQH
jgi:prepilin-type processing-associated H-X9-DG protein/prepilin-type N-terminal cleavage/methylation domain-containing protein